MGNDRIEKAEKWVLPAYSVILTMSLVCCTAAAQQIAPVTSQNSPSVTVAKSQGEKETEREIQKQEQSQRILGVVPMFGTTSRQDPPPLTASQKFHLFAKSSFDPFVFVSAGIQAGISQSQNEFPAYGQGMAGYAKRYAATLGDSTSGSFFGGFLYPVLLKQDPRYFRLGQGSAKHRIGYALAQAFVCRTDKGGRAFNYSSVLGAFSSGALSNAYYPPSDRGFGLTMSRTGISMIYGSAGGLVDEFWPDIHHKFFEKHKKKQPTP